MNTLDVGDLPPYDISSQAPLWWGQLLHRHHRRHDVCHPHRGLFVCAAADGCLATSGDQYPHLLLPTLSLIALLISAPFSYLASEAAKQNDRAGMIRNLVLNLVFAAICFTLRILEWRSLNFNWQADAQGSYVWAFLGLHSFDFIADAIFTLVLLILILIGRYGEKQRLGVHVDSVIWYFLVAVWIPIYIVIYWGPHIFGSQ